MKETFEMHGCTWEIVKRYQLTDEYMQAHDLYCRDRISIRCIKGNGYIKPGFTQDFAAPPNFPRK